jgi:hypothetical protein
MKRRRFESEAARLFDWRISLDRLHTKNVLEASVLCSSGCVDTIRGSSRRPGKLDEIAISGVDKKARARPALSLLNISVTV